MGAVDQSIVDTSFVPERHPEARARWAIQIATVDSLKWRGYQRISKILGRNSVEHSFTRMAQIWCDENDRPLKDPQTGEHYSPIYVRGQLNPAAIDPETGDFIGLRVDPYTVEDMLSSFVPDRLIRTFNRKVFGHESRWQEKCKLGVFSLYGDDIQWCLEADHVVEEPIMVGDQENVETLWGLYLERAAEVNKKKLDYDLVRHNCHTVNAVLNQTNTEAVEMFASRGFLRWGARSDAIIVDTSEVVRVIKPLREIQDLNFQRAHEVFLTRQQLVGQVPRSSQAPQQDSQEPAFEYN